MYRRTNRQKALPFTPPELASASAQARLAAGWAPGFREKVFPALLAVEDKFAALYPSGTGRPTWGVARVLGMLLLKELNSLTDDEAIDALAFDFRWRFALDLPAQEAYLSRQSLSDLRTRIASHQETEDLVSHLFLHLFKVAADDLHLSTKGQRLDATYVTSNIMTRGRADLFARTLELFVRELRKHHRALLGRVPADMVEWVEGKGEGSLGFGWGRSELVKVKLSEMAGWAVAVRDGLAGERRLAKFEPYLLVCRLVDELVVVTPNGEGGTNVEVRAKATPTIAGALLVSPHDPDASWGFKGPGYHVQIVETFGNEGTTELITHFEVHPAGENDRNKVPGILDVLMENGLRPVVLAADAGYSSGAAIVYADSLGVELLCPVNQSKLPNDALGRDRWERDSATGRLSKCPAGVSVVRHTIRGNTDNEPRLHAMMDGETCKACPLAARCLVRGPTTGRSASHWIPDTQELLRRDQRFAEQRTTAWRQRYAVRHPIESTNSELKRRHGLGRLRVRRRAAVQIAVGMKVSACNIKRWLRATKEVK